MSSITPFFHGDRINHHGARSSLVITFVFIMDFLQQDNQTGDQITQKYRWLWLYLTLVTITLAIFATCSLFEGRPKSATVLSVLVGLLWMLLAIVHVMIEWLAGINAASTRRQRNREMLCSATDTDTWASGSLEAV